MTEAVVHVIRHGEVHNPGSVLYGRLPGFHLSANGHAMAQRVAEFMSQTTPCHLRVSPLERAQETMRPIAQAFPHLDVVIDDDLIEADNAFVGQVFGPKNKALWNPKNWWKLRNPFAPSWGEHYNLIVERMSRAVRAAARQAEQNHFDTSILPEAGAATTDRLAMNCHNPTAILVSHQLPIWLLRLHATGNRLWHNPRSRQCTLGSVTSFTVNGDNIQLLSYAEPAIDLIPVKNRNDNFSSGGNDPGNPDPR